MRSGALIVLAACVALMAPSWARAEEPASAAGEVQPSNPTRLAQADRRPGAWVSMPSRRSEPARSTSPSGSTSLFGSLFGPSSGVPSQYQRQTVRYETKYAAGTIVIDTSNRYLYHVRGDGTATRYGVGVGRQGFSWKGQAYIGDKREWPGWTPPPAMRAREPWLPAHMPGGPDNPLGARAMYLYRGGADTLYRIHGTNQPDTIGQALSSGCIRMLNADVEYLYEQVKHGTKVVVI